MEHEIVGHVMDKLKGIDRGSVRKNEANAIKKGNEYRQRHGIKFHRHSHDAKFKRRKK